ncbi:MAG: hypothetical protein JXJ22_11870 [Bacteroidales bacterium]|nr:hypothetical protein [Bacteroidales bacterium]
MKIKPKNCSGILLIVVLFIFSFTGCDTQKDSKSLNVYFQSDIPQQQFGIKKLEALRTIKKVNTPEEADIIVVSSEEEGIVLNGMSLFQTITSEGFIIKKLPGKKVAVIAADPTGVMYGLLELAEQFQMGKTLKTIKDKSVNPKVAIRGIKFNLPWNSYRVDTSLQLHYETVRDLEFWSSFLDMMAENRLNALTLWNLHPFPYMIKPINFPEACPFSDEEMESWQFFWHSLFQMAADRGIKTYMINWNIFVSPEFAKAHNVADYCLPEMEGKEYYGDGDYSEIVQRYNRECMTQLINEYPELTGFGVSQNERMDGVEEQVWQNWIVDTYFDAMDSADHKIEFILRAHTHPAPELTRKAIEDNAYRLETIYVPVKFNWSHAHATPDLMYIHGGSRSKSLWDPAPENYKMIFTMRNEDFFILRWGEPNFVREMLAKNNQDYIGGFLIGSETYIPAKEYITKPGPHLTWNYGFEKQWLFYKVWGRLLYDPSTEDEVFVNAFDSKYNIDFGDKLLEAHKIADQMPLKLASFYAASWDFTLYSEGFLAGYRSNMGCYYDSISPFISVDEIIRTITLDTNLVSIQDFVSGKYTDQQKISPLQLAETLAENGNKTLEIIKTLKTEDPTLIHEISDLKSWALLSLYFSEKLKGGTVLQYFRTTVASEKQKESIQHLETALGYWEQLVEANKPYLDEIPLLHLGDRFNNGGNLRPMSKFSWANFTDEVKYDIEIAKNSTAGKP